MALENYTQIVKREYSDQTFLQKKVGMLRELCMLGEFGRVLYVGAHPDDENNRLLTFLAKDSLLKTGYLSLTRGEGGQNFIGAEKGLDLGVLRVQESLAAREIEGTTQFFTRAKDFGFTQSAQDTLQRWDEEHVLADMVWTIRYFRPDVVITRFSPDLADLHGHHQASAILTSRAFDLAADPTAYAEQLKELQPWQTKRLLWNVYSDSGVKDIGGPVTPLPKHLALTIPAESFTSGVHYGELAAESRNKHRSQAMGCLVQQQATVEYFELLKGEVVDPPADNFLAFHVESKDPYGSLFSQSIRDLIRKYEHEGDIALDLATILRWMEIVPDNSIIHEKRSDLERLLLQATGVSFAFQALEKQWVPGADVSMVLNAEIPQGSGVVVSNVIIPFFEEQDRNYQLSHSDQITLRGRLDPSLKPSFPRWLRSEGDINNYAPDSHADVVLTKQDGVLNAQVQLQFAGMSLNLVVPVLHQANPVVVTPPVTATFGSDILVLSDVDSRSIALELTSHVSAIQSLTVRLLVPKGLEVSPQEIKLKIAGGEAEKVQFELRSIMVQEQIQQVGFEIEIENTFHHFTSKHITYPHINEISYFPKGILPVLNSSVGNVARKVAYIAGKNDELAGSLLQLVDYLEIIPFERVELVDLLAFDAIVLGIRIYNTHPTIAFSHLRFREYVEQGGVLITQYNTPYDLSVNDVGTYPLTVSQERITDTESPIYFLDPTHRILNYPNVIGQHDFRYWVQDRALFLPTEWDSDFEPILRSENSDGNHLDGLLLLRRKGKGFYIYSSLSLFRQLPAGVAGAYRLFANILSLGSN